MFSVTEIKAAVQPVHTELQKQQAFTIVLQYPTSCLGLGVGQGWGWGLSFAVAGAEAEAGAGVGYGFGLTCESMNALAEASEEEASLEASSAVQSANAWVETHLSWTRRHLL